MTTSIQKPVPVEILLVEDSATDADLTLRSFRKERCENRIHHVKDGVEALAFLRREDGYEQAPAADVLLLDLNLPRMDGWELLREIRGDASLASLFVVALTTSDEDGATLDSRGLRADAWLVKPVTLKAVFNVVGGVDRFGFEIVRLSPAGDAG